MANQKDKDTKQWESQSIEELEAILQYNDNIIADSNKTIKRVEGCNKKIEEILKRKREEQVKQELAEKAEKLKVVLSLMEHTSSCQRNSKSSNYSCITTGLYENGRCYCPKCTLEYLIENPWAGFGFRITAQFDLDGDGIFDDGNY